MPKFLALFSLPLIGYSPFALSAVECSGNVCAEISDLDPITIIPTENMLSDTTPPPLVAVEDYCAYAYNSSSNRATNYDVQFLTETNTQDLGNGNFRIGGNNGPGFNLKWRGNPDNAYTNISTNGLTADTEGALNCNQRNAQASLQLTMTAAQLQATQPGAYTGTLSMDMGQGNSVYHSRVDFEVLLPKLAKISGLQDVAVSRRNARDTAYVETRSFCVFVWGGGSYTLRADSTNASGGQFRLVSGGSFINYRLRLQPTEASFDWVTPGESLTSNGSSDQIDCGGSTNARVRIRIDDANINNKPTGIFRDTLTLTVEPT